MAGPEDSPSWSQMLRDSNGTAVEFCHNCGRQIVFWHCTETGCPWCRQCGLQPRMRVTP